MLPTKTTKKPLVITGVALAIAAIFAGLAYIRIVNQPRLTIGNKTINIELAQTEAEHSAGLSGREKLAADAGMLFVYNGYYQPKFWMKDMNFPIDLIWIKDGMITGFEKNLPPEGTQPSREYQPADFINQVLEVPAGFIDKNRLGIGDRAVRLK